MKHCEQSLFIVAIVVVLVHGVAIYWVAIRSEALFFSKAEKRLVVNTVTVRQPKPAESKPVVKPPPSKPAPVASKKPPPPKKPAEVKKPTVVKKDPFEERKRQLIANAQASMAKIRDTGPAKKTSSELKDLEVIESLRIDSPDIVCAEDKGYYGALAARLRAGLRLPELGEVRIRLTLNRAGRVVKVETLNAESEYNKQHVEKMLPKLQFPPFGKNFGNASQHTFTITLTNDA